MVALDSGRSEAEGQEMSQIARFSSVLGWGNHKLVFYAHNPASSVGGNMDLWT